MIKLSSSINSMLVNKKTEKMFLIGKLQADWKKIVGEHINKNVDINQILVEIAGQSTLSELSR